MDSLKEAARARIAAAVESDTSPSALAATVARELDAHAAHPEVQTSILRMTWRLAADGAFATRAAQAQEAAEPHAVRVLADAALRALRANAAADAALVDAALTIFGNVKIAPALAAQTAGAVFGTAADVLLGQGDFAAHAADAELAMAACVALNNGMCDERKRRLAADAGALGAFVATMQQFPGRRDVQRAACVALHSLFTVSFATELHAEADACHAAADATVMALRAFPDDKELISSAALALGAVVRNNEQALQTPALLRHGVDAVLASLRRHGADAEVVVAVCFALACLHPDLESVLAPAAAEAAADAIMTALQTHEAHTGVQERALSALGFLCKRAHAAVHAVQAGAVAATLRAMRGYPTDANVQANACIMIADISAAPGTAIAPVDAFALVTAVTNVLRAGNGSSGDAAAWARGAADCCEKTNYVPEAWACSALNALVNTPNLYPTLAEKQPRCMRAVHAGALGLLQGLRVRTATASVAEIRSILVPTLQAAADAHVQSGRACTKCAALRTCGAMCGFAGCAVCARPDGGRLLVCARCQRAAYCGPEHQRAAWRASHKAECCAAPTTQ
jgi:hypothetical protein